MKTMALLLLGVAICWAPPDIVCKKGKSFKRRNIGDGDSFTFKTQAGEKYAPNTNCHVTFKKKVSCSKIRFYCFRFKVNNKHKHCKGKDKMQLQIAQTKTAYCGMEGPNVTTSAKHLKISFLSDNRKQSSGAVCRVECVENTDTHTAKFHVFQTKYNKFYSNQKEKVKRFNIWQNRTNLMNEHNKQFHEGKKRYRKGENAMFDMTLKEIEANYMGLILQQKSLASKVSKMNIDFSDLPASINWIENGSVTSVKNQAGCGSCWAHSAAGALEGAYKKDTNRLVNMDVAYLIDCSTTDGCLGANPGTVFNHVMLNGITVDNETYRSNTNSSHKKENSHADQYIMDRNSQCVLDNNYPVIIRAILRLNTGKEDELMQAVAEIGPVSVLICAPMDLVDYAGEVFYEENCSEACNTPSYVNHAALVVGYGEQMNKITNEPESYWLVKNSWGTEWGDQGYIKMARNRSNNCGIASIATYPTVWGDLICGEDLDDLLVAGENAELEIQCCDKGKIFTCSGIECKTVCGADKPIECLRPVEDFENIENCDGSNVKIALVKITAGYCKYRAPCPRFDGTNQYCSCCKYSFYYRRYKGGKGCAPKCNPKNCPRSAPVNHDETGSDLICQEQKDSYFSNFTETNSSLTVLCCDNGKTTPKSCTGSDCSEVCDEDLTCIKMVDSLAYSDHCYNDVLLVLRTEDACNFAPCPSAIADNAMFCKCCEFFSYRKTCPVCSSSSCSNVAVHEVILSAGGGGAEFDAEVFIPSSGKSCKLNPLPSPRHYFSINTIENIPILCGGYYNAATQKSCIQFAPNSASGKWTDFSTMMERRFAPDAWLSKAGLVIMGGSATTEIVPNGGFNFTLVVSSGRACSITIEDSVVLTGGMTDLGAVYQYDLKGLVKSLPRLNNGRYGHGCGTYLSNGQRVLVVVSGGTPTTEKYVMGGTSWVYGNPIPFTGLSEMGSASLDNKVFLIGGHCCKAADGLNGRRREIYEYDGEDWTNVGTLLNGRWGFSSTTLEMTQAEIDGLPCQ